MNKKGFTLMEMLMVMFIISILLLLMIPNIAKQKKGVDKTGCESFASMVETQLTAYELIEGSEATSLDQLKEAGYINSTTCSDGTSLSLNDGDVIINEK